MPDLLPLSCGRAQDCLERTRLQPQHPRVAAPRPSLPCLELHNLPVLDEGLDGVRSMVSPSLFLPQQPSSGESKSCPLGERTWQ